MQTLWLDAEYFDGPVGFAYRPEERALAKLDAKHLKRDTFNAMPFGRASRCTFALEPMKMNGEECE